MPNDSIRRTVELTDDHEVLPPEVEIVGDVPEEIVEAVEAAVEENPNNLDSPKLIGGADGHALAVLTASYNEIPVSTGDGPEDYGWVAPYRSREEIDATLLEELPDDIIAEAENAHATGFYRQ